MKKTVIAAALILLSINSIGQTVNADSIARVEANKFIDSTSKKITLFEFNQWVYENVPQKTAAEGSWVQLYNGFLQFKYDAWVKSKYIKPKK